MVTVMHARASEPNWGPEVLARQALLGSLDELPGFWHEWEHWAADVSESHSSYPILIGLRSAKARRNGRWRCWPAMDAAAPYSWPSRRSCRRVGAHDAAAGHGVFRGPGRPTGTPRHRPTRSSPSPVRTMSRCRARISSTRWSGSATPGFPCTRTGEDAWLVFRQWRSFYERQAYLCDHIDAVRPLVRVPHAGVARGASHDDDPPHGRLTSFDRALIVRGWGHPPGVRSAVHRARWPT